VRFQEERDENIRAAHWSVKRVVESRSDVVATCHLA
jgi:hypothetical protein